MRKGIPKWCSAIFFGAAAALGGEVVQVSTPTGNIPSELSGLGMHRLPASSGSFDAITFASYSALVPQDTNGLSDVYVWSRATASLRLVSLGTNGPANGASYDPVLSQNGRYVAFISTASNSVADTNKVEDVYLADLQSGALEIVSTKSLNVAARLGTTRDPVISADGRFVAYVTLRADIVSVGGSSSEHVLVRDRQLGQTYWAGTATIEAARPGTTLFFAGPELWFRQANNIYSFNVTNQVRTLRGSSTVMPALSADRRTVAFQSATVTTNIVSRYSIASNATEVVTRSTNGPTRGAAISVSKDGRVAFLTDMPLIETDTNGSRDLYVTAAIGGSNNLVLASSFSPAPGEIITPSKPIMSDDGKKVFFRAATTNQNDHTLKVEYYVSDLSGAPPQKLAGASGLSQNLSAWTPGAGGAFFLAEANTLGFVNPSILDDLVFVPFPLPELRLQIGKENNGWRLTFPKAMNLTVRFQETVGNPDWTNLTNSFEDSDLNFSVLDTANSTTRIYQLIAP